MTDPAERFFSEAVLQEFRAMAEGNHPHLAQRYVPVDTDGPTGGEVNTAYQATAQLTGCRLEPADVQEGLAQDTILDQQDFTLALPITAEVNARDQFFVQGTAIGGDYSWTCIVEVVGTPGPHTWESERVVRVIRRTPVTKTHYRTFTSAVAPVGTA